ncbi:divalent metal cation transporter [Kitasatospora sp. NPDC085895]|uniref:divalent metal cation transporter n=1 Tax=Kitasatospora sp. NPDC085895 TaxID=3155057 RepID=UPI00344BA49B
MVDRGAKPADHRLIRADAVLGAVFACAISLTVVIATASAIGGSGPLESAAQAVEALGPVAGYGAELLFAFGLIGASALAGAVVPLSAGSASPEPRPPPSGEPDPLKDDRAALRSAAGRPECAAGADGRVRHGERGAALGCARCRRRSGRAGPMLAGWLWLTLVAAAAAGSRRSMPMIAAALAMSQVGPHVLFQVRHAAAVPRPLPALRLRIRDTTSAELGSAAGTTSRRPCPRGSRQPTGLARSLGRPASLRSSPRSLLAPPADGEAKPSPAVVGSGHRSTGANGCRAVRARRQPAGPQRAFEVAQRRATSPAAAVTCKVRANPLSNRCEMGAGGGRLSGGVG